MGKTADTLGRMKFQLPQNLSKLMLQIDKVKLLMLVSEFMVKSRLKILHEFSMEFMECLNENLNKNDTFFTSGVGPF